MKVRDRFLSVLAILLLCPGAAANDGGIGVGGSPRLLRSHPTVSMRSERVLMTIGPDSVKVDCRFVFHNSGSACRVRIGFPDIGRGAWNLDDDPLADPKKLPTRGTFDDFRSYVNGKRVPTRLIRADRPGHFWHAKWVRFPAHGSLQIREVYTVAVGFQMASRGAYDQAGYILHTGGSWRGPIGYTEVRVRFHRTGVTGSLRPVKVKGDPGEMDWTRMDSNRIYYRGPSAPVTNGRELRFLRTRWNPTKHDDLFLYFRSLGLPR